MSQIMSPALDEYNRGGWPHTVFFIVKNGWREAIVALMRVTLSALRLARTRECCGALLVLALFARALIPVGFMPVASHGGLEMVLCDGSSGGALGADPAHPAPRGAHTDSSCPFAQSAGVAPPPVALRVANFLPVEFTEVRDSFDPYQPSTEIPRYASPRGPPQFL